MFEFVHIWPKIGLKQPSIFWVYSNLPHSAYDGKYELFPVEQFVHYS